MQWHGPDGHWANRLTRYPGRNLHHRIIESIGAALSPLLVGIIADQMSLKSAFLIICSSAWALCAVFFGLTAYLVPRDIETLHQQLQARAGLERERHARREEEVA